VDGVAQPIGGSAMATDDLEVAGRQGVETAEVTFGQIGGNADECVALFGSQQSRGLSYHSARSMQPAAGMAGSGIGAGESITMSLLIDSRRYGGLTELWLHLNDLLLSLRGTGAYS
jgi:hypothetical protein